MGSLRRSKSQADPDKRTLSDTYPSARLRYGPQVIGWLSAALCFTACSGSHAQADQDGGAGGGGGSAGTFTLAGAGGGALAEGGAASMLGAATCTAEVRHGEHIPADLYI